MDRRLLALLVCPLCKGSLVYDKPKQYLVCKADKLAFPIEEGIPMMLDTAAKSLTLEEVEAYR